ncbi:hypothetical protein U0070_011034, partial [Myodes glareolus]
SGCTLLQEFAAPNELRSGRSGGRESPVDVSRQSQPQTTLQNQTEAALQRAAPLPASHQSRTRAQQLSHRQPGSGKP